MTRAQELYDASVRDLPAAERLRLAALILADLTGSPLPLDVSDSWSDEDIADLKAFCLRTAEAEYPIGSD